MNTDKHGFGQAKTAFWLMENNSLHLARFSGFLSVLIRVHPWLITAFFRLKAGHRTSLFKHARRSGLLGLRVFLLAFLPLVISDPLQAEEPDRPASALKLYNDGTQKLRDGKLQEAEACLQGAIASQNEKLQPPALYNLGEVRFQQGAEELKKGPSPPRANAAASAATENGSEAIKSIDQALASEDMQTMIAAYFQGRGARKELKAATAAVKHAMETSGSVLEKWRRAAGDFKGSYELSPANTDARTNADVVDRWIAKLVDQQQMMMQAAMAMEQKKGDLGKKMAELKKKLPDGEGDKLKGNGGDDDDEDAPPKKPMEGEEKPDPKEGKEMQLTVEEAARMLDTLKLDSNRKLPMGIKEEGKPGDRKGRDW